MATTNVEPGVAPLPHISVSTLRCITGVVSTPKKDALNCKFATLRAPNASMQSPDIFLEETVVVCWCGFRVPVGSKRIFMLVGIRVPLERDVILNCLPQSN